MLQPEYQDGLPLAVALENQLGVNRFDSAQSMTVSTRLVMLMIRLGRLIKDPETYIGVSLRKSPLHPELELHTGILFNSPQVMIKNEQVVVEAFQELVYGETGKIPAKKELPVIVQDIAIISYHPSLEVDRVFQQEASRIGGEFHHLESLKPYQYLLKPTDVAIQDGLKHRSKAKKGS